MVFKLVRIDKPESLKIQLTIGKHVIGRGRFLHDDDTDKRVSRNHAEMEVSENSISLKALHQNPCFFIKKNTTETELLQLNDTISLGNGDKFGILPVHFWYEVLYCTQEEATAQDGSILSNHSVNNDRMEGLETTQVQNQNDVHLCNGRQEGEVRTNDEMEEDSNVQIKEEVEDPDTSASLLNQDIQNINTNPQAPAGLQLSSDDTRSPRKRSPTRSPSPTEVKKVKTEPVTPGDAQAGPSNNSGSDNVKADVPASPTKPPDNTPRRERCIYGANCYRRNPQHKAQFSHPTDSDWGHGSRGVCPYGAACRKLDPRHWAQHEHPPGVNPPDPNAPRPGMQVVQRHGNIFYINARSINFYDDHFQVEDSDGDSVDYDYEF